jgi:hypothetical protein
MRTEDKVSNDSEGRVSCTHMIEETRSWCRPTEQ